MTSLLKHLNNRIYWLFIADILSVCVASFGWLLIRFDIFDIPADQFRTTMIYLLPDIGITIFVFWIFRLYHTVWRFASLGEILNLFYSVLLVDGIELLYKQVVLTQVMPRVPWSFFIVAPMLLFFCSTFARMSIRIARRYLNDQHHPHHKRKTMVIGGGTAAYMLINEMALNPGAENQIVCIVDDNPAKQGKYIRGIKIMGDRSQIHHLVKQFNVEEIIIAIPSASSKTMTKLVEICYETDCRVRRLPYIANITQGSLSENIRDVSYEDLLSRKPIDPEHAGIRDKLMGKVVLVTGGAGSIGSELCRQIAAFKPKQLIIFELNENSSYRLLVELKKKYPEVDVRILIGSVRDMSRLEYVFSFYKPQLVYHAAAHKHVPLMEDAPGEAIKNNCKGTLNICQMADKYGVEDFLLISTDKAVRPTNIMGATKRIAEMVVQYYAHHSSTRFVAVRFGNVLGSDGSVVPMFIKQIEEGGPVTVTHPDITRFFMTIPEAVSLILEAALLAKGGEIFILDMGKQVRIYDMAEKLIRMKGYRPGADIKIQITGLRPGEKLYEELLMDEEGIQKTENDLIFVGQPITFDEEHFLSKLSDLFAAATRNQPDLKEQTSELCETYQFTENRGGLWDEDDE